MKRPVVLIILDGWGVGKREESNPIHVAQPKTIAYLKQTYAIGALQAGGIAVGLPWDEVGNSEVGHLTIGAGKVVYQHYPRITLAIQDKSFFDNAVLKQLAEHTRKNRSGLHLVGLLTEGNIHASFEHLVALLRFAKQQSVPQVYLHLFSDGKDSKPQSVRSLLARLQEAIKTEGIGVLASLSGRHFGLDRDGHWDRTELAYKAMTSHEGISEAELEQALSANDEKDHSDEYLPPVTIGPVAHPISNNDAILFTDFREDSIRQIAAAFIMPDFDKFPRTPLANVMIATMTEYSEKFQVPVAFPSEVITAPLGKVLSDAGKTQMLVAETEKYAHVTYFFNGYRDEPFKGQFKVLIPSRNVARHDERPEMMAEEIAGRVIEAVEDKSFDFVVANFANPDIIAHTGNFNATLKAIQVIDTQLGRIVKVCEANEAILLITADHGNAEELNDVRTGGMETSHDSNPVPFFLVGKEFVRVKNESEALRQEREVVGILSDVAPTVLGLLGVKQPPEMTGRSLLRYL